MSTVSRSSKHHAVRSSPVDEVQTPAKSARKTSRKKTPAPEAPLRSGAKIIAKGPRGGVSAAAVLTGALQTQTTRLSPAVPVEVQRRTLAAMEQRIDDILAGGSNAVGEIDLDLTSLLPVTRVEAALRQMAAQYNEPALAHPENLDFIPGYTETAFPAWVRESGFGDSHPEWRNMSRLPNYWGAADLDTDELNPGLQEFLQRQFAKRGPDGERFFAVFNSGRSTGMPEDSMAPFRRAGFDIGIFDEQNPHARQAVLFIGNNGSDAETKRRRQPAILGIGQVAFVVDDRKTNRDAVFEGLEANGVARDTVLDVAIAAPRFSVEPEARNNPVRISSFERV